MQSARCAGGHGFLEKSVPGFLPVLFAQSIIAWGFIASHVLFDGRSVLDFRIEIIMLVVILLPLCLWAPQLAATRWKALQDYRVLGTSYVRGFEEK